MTDGVENYPLVPQPTQRLLTERELVDYRDNRERFQEWLLHEGKNPDEFEGYSEYTVRDTMYRTDQFWRYIWTEFEPDETETYSYTLSLSTDHGDSYLKHLSRQEQTVDHKATAQRAIKRLYKYRKTEFGGVEWDPDRSFTPARLGQPRDFLTKPERQKIREAAIEYGSVPSYSNLDPDDRDRWKTHLAQRFEKPKAQVGPDDWDRANGWKIPSLVWTSLDAGLRPVEIKRAHAGWVDLNNNRLTIPVEEASKNRDNWKPPLTDRTTAALGRWLDERKLYDEYGGEQAPLWATKRGNPFDSDSLRYLLQRLFEVAEIPQENRQVSWYMIRHSTGTYVSREEGLEAARQVLRHKSPETTMRYDQVPEEDLRDALNKIG